MRFFKKLRKRSQLDRDLEDELRFHLEMSGNPQKFGNATLIKETCRDLWSFVWLESLWQDFRYAIRTLSGSPGVMAAAIAALALGIGANTTVYTIVSQALKFDIGIPQPERLVLISIDRSQIAEVSKNPFDPRFLIAQLKSLDLIGAFRFHPVSVADAAGPPDRYSGFEVSTSGLQMIGRAPVLGRIFTAEDERDGAPVVLLSHGVWQDRYGSDPSMIGRTIRVDEVPRVVIGVMPARMQFPEDTSLWIPFSRAANANQPMLIGRLAEGVKLPRARSEIDALARNLVPRNAKARSRPLVDIEPMMMLYGVYASRPLFYAQLVAVGFVLLIACADVANLLLGRAAVRAREISIRIAIGAGRARIVRQLLVESAVLAIAGGFLGWLIAVASLHWFDHATATLHRPPWMDFSMNPRVWIYLAAITLGTSILFGLAPALRLARIDVNHTIKEGGQGASGGTRGRAIGNILVAFEMALCVILLTGAGLLIHSALNVYRAPIGVDPTNVLTMRFRLPEAKYPKDEDRISFQEQLKTRLEALPGVEGVALTSALPTIGFGVSHQTCELEGSGVAIPAVESLTVSANYFHEVRAQILRGRAFKPRETSVAIVNEAFALSFFPSDDLIGKRLRVGSRWLTIVGIASNIEQDFRRPLEREPLVYTFFNDAPPEEMFLTARTTVPPAGLVQAFRKQLQALDENLPAYDIKALDERIAQNRLEVGAICILLTIFAGIALVMAFVGLYAVVAHAVGQRTQEIGIRVAMGANPRDILSLVFAQGLRPVAYGLLIGLPAAFGVARILRMALAGVSPTDPATFAAVILTLTLACILGCAIPASRALRVDPVIALRRD